MARTLIVGDVHGCAGELERLVRKARPTRVILAGDLFTKGPDPQGVWKLIQRHEMEAVLGNTDLKVIKGWPPGKRLPKKAHAWLAQLPWFVKGRGFVVVHAGVNPERGLKGTSREMALTLRRWPTDKPKNPQWWELYTRKRLVLHGHSARQGLIDRRPHSLGLDTGCVYGGRLTGYLLEKDKLVSVKAKRVWLKP